MKTREDSGPFSETDLRGNEHGVFAAKRILGVAKPLLHQQPALLVKTPVAVEKGTKAVISVNFSVYGRRTCNNLRTNFAVESP